MDRAKACNEIIEKIESGIINNGGELEKQKIHISKKHLLTSILKNADILPFAKSEKAKKLLMTKPVRTLSGIASIAVMWKGDCPGKCIYCPRGKGSLDGKEFVAPKSYTGYEPATLRAIRSEFDPYKQVRSRLKQLEITGHNTSKCELIIMGGTFMCQPEKDQEDFIKRCMDAMNERESTSLEEAQELNEDAKHRCIGLTIETRADYCKKEHIEQMLKLGCTRVELGVQSTDDEILKMVKRGNTCSDNKEAIRLLKEGGLKVCVHWMPGLTGLKKIDVDKEAVMFSELLEYMPDEIKIYPVLVIEGTELYELWKKGEYEPFSNEQMIGLLIKLKQTVPKWIRIKRIMRDIPEGLVDTGPKKTNLRQVAKERMDKGGIKCNCIRCREIKDIKPKQVDLKEIAYDSGKEIFLSLEFNDMIVAFLRLRIDSSETEKIRELHVYGKMVAIDEKGRASQHRGFGRQLMNEAERIALKYKKKEIWVTSGVGARKYYKKLGYEKKGFYMAKSL